MGNPRTNGRHLVVLEKRCRTCGEIRGRDQFHLQPRNGDGLQGQCRSCKSNYDRQRRLARPQWWRLQCRGWSRANPEKRRLIQLRHRLKAAFGISIEQWESMIESQGRRCAISGVPLSGGRDTHVDHDHATGLIRGVLNERINLGLGMFSHNSEWLRRAADYLEDRQRRSSKDVA